MEKGLGKSLIIPDSVLSKIDAADAKIKKLVETSDNASKQITAAFSQMAIGVDPFISNLQIANGLLGTSNINEFGKAITNIGSISQDSASKVASLSESLSRVGRNGNSSSSDEKYFEDYGKWLENKKNQEQAEADAAIAAQQKVSDAEQKRVEQIMKSYDEQKKAHDKLVSSQLDAASRLDARDDAASISKSNAEKREAISLEKAYNSAMSASEGTIAQRSNKIAKLNSVEEQLTRSGKDYTDQLNKIRTETQRLSTANDSAIKKQEEFRKSQRNLMDTSGQLERKLALIFSVSAITGYVDKLISVRGEFELQNRSLEAILQNKEEADRLFSQITELAIQSPFRLKELVTYTKQLAAYRVESSKLYDTTKMLADISSGLGVDMDRLVLAYGQVKAANYLRGQELRQFSEAGINILGELSKYFSELEGRAVSVSEVFEMVSKRMVSFGDVETVFKRLTSAGGIFYNMQEIQAETLQGQISNLKDSMDIMFNDIGKANDGVLKNSVAIVRSLVNNWRIISDILKAAAAGYVLYTVAAIRAARAEGAFAAAQIATTASGSGLVPLFAKLNSGLKSLYATLAANPWILVATAAIGAISYLVDLHDEAEESRKQYDILTNSNIRQSEALNALSSEFDKNNKAISDANTELANSAKNSDAHRSATERLNDATQKQQGLLQKLKTDFPDVYAGIVKQKKGVIDLTAAQKRYNTELERTNTLNYLMKQAVGLFGTDFAGEAKDAEQSYKDRKKGLDDIKTAYSGIRAEIMSLLNTNDDVNKKYGSTIRNILNGTDSYDKKLRLIQKEVDYGIGTNIFNQISKTLKSYYASTRGMSNEIDNLNDKYEILRDKALETIGLTTEQFKKASNDQKAIFQDLMTRFLNSAKGSQSKYVRSFISQRLKQDLNIRISFDKKEIQQDLDKVKIEINKQAARINKESGKNVLTPIAINESTDDYFKNIISNVKSLREEAKRASVATKPLYDNISNESKAKELNKQANALYALANSYGYFDSKTEKVGESAYEKRLNTQFALLKKISSEYDTLLKNNSAEEAASKIYKSFATSYKEAGLGNIQSLSMDFEGIARKMESILPPIGNKLRDKFQKDIGEIKVQIDAEIKKKNEEDIKKQISNIFDSYDLGQDLKKLGLDNETISSLFNVKVFDLDEAKSQINSLKPEVQKFGEEGDKIMRDAIDKIDDYQQKKTLDNLKTYSKYLKESMSERVQIQLDGMKQIEDINNLYNQKLISSQQAQTMKSGVQTDTQSKLDTASWNEFKNSDLYIKMFEDLQFTSTKALDLMRNKLIALRSSLKNLPPEDLKEIVSQLDKIDNQLNDRNVFLGLSTSIKGYMSYLKSAKQLNEAFVKSTEQESLISDQVDAQQLLIHNLEEQYSKEKNISGEKSASTQKAKNELDIARQMLNVLIAQLKAQGLNTKEIEKQISLTEPDREKTAKSIQKYSQYLSDFSSGITSISSDLENVFGTMSSGTKDTISSIAEIAQGVAQTGEGVAGIVASNGADISSWIKAAGGVAKTIGAIFNIGDKKKERQIQKEIKNVENLEKQYKKLEKAITNAYTIDTLTQSTKLAKENMEAQIASYNNMIAKEEDKKKTDQSRIDDWKDKISDLQDQIKQLAEDTLVSLGGIGDSNYKSAAEEFADAWLTAFDETGNGITGINEKWDDFINNMVKKQLALKVFGKYLQPIFDQFDKMFSDASDKGQEVTKQELDDIKKKFSDASKTANDYANTLMNSLGLTGSKTTSTLSALTQSLQSASESAVQEQNAYLNSIRFFSSEQLTVMRQIYESMSSPDVNKNVILSELKTQTMLITSINKLFGSVISSQSHPKYGGAFIKVGM